MRRICSVDEKGRENYDEGMTLDSVLKAVRGVFQKTRARAESGPPEATSPAGAEGDAVDPFDPFPDPVVLEFRDILDLHSIPPKQVHDVVEGYLDEARARRCPFVRIIHGKGIGVQRDLVRAILSRTPYVLDFQDAPPEAGGWGATIARLRVERKK